MIVEKRVSQENFLGLKATDGALLSRAKCPSDVQPVSLRRNSHRKSGPKVIESRSERWSAEKSRKIFPSEKSDEKSAGRVRDGMKIEILYSCSRYTKKISREKAEKNPSSLRGERASEKEARRRNKPSDRQRMMFSVLSESIYPSESQTIIRFRLSLCRSKHRQPGWRVKCAVLVSAEKWCKRNRKFGAMFSLTICLFRD